MTEPIAIDHYFGALAPLLGVDRTALDTYSRDLDAHVDFFDALALVTRGVPEFAAATLARARDFRAYRGLLYVATRARRPAVVVETGVLNGFGSAFILLAMADNGAGKLVSIDRPPTEERVLAQGTTRLPATKAPGWAIPDALRERHLLRLGDARDLLPGVLRELGSIDAFVHDSDHAYDHVLFELGIAHRHLRPGGLLIVDNVEQSSAFADFAREVGEPTATIASFDSEDRVWKTGLLVRSATW